MRKYIIKNSIKYFRSNIKIYSLFMIEILIAIAMLNIFMSISVSSEEHFQKLLKNAKNEGANIIRATGVPNVVNGEKFIEKEDYYHIKEKFKDDIEVGIKFKEVMTVFKDGNIDSVNIIIASNEYLKHELEIDNEEFIKGKTVIVGKRTKEILENVGEYEILPSEKRFPKVLEKMKINDGKLILEKGTDKIELKCIVDKSNKIIEHVNPYDKSYIETVDISKSIILPIDLVDEYIEFDDSKVAEMKIYFPDGIYKGDVILKIIREMEKRHSPQYRYGNSNILDDINEIMESYDSLGKNVNIIVLSCLIIIVIGINGIMLMSIHKRKRNIAIAMTMGATVKQVISEVLMELLLIVIPPTGIATAISIWLIKNKIEFNEFNVIVSWKVICTTSLIGVGVAILSSVVPMMRIKKLSPLEILRKC